MHFEGDWTPSSSSSENMTVDSLGIIFCSMFAQDGRKHTIYRGGDLCPDPAVAHMINNIGNGMETG